MNCNIVGSTDSIVAQLDPVCVDTVVDRLCECQFPYGTYTVEHDGPSFTVEFTQEQQVSFFNKACSY